MISLAEYGTPYKVSELVKANPEHADVLIFDAGVDLIIPTVEVENVSTLPPWKRGAISE